MSKKKIVRYMVRFDESGALRIAGIAEELDIEPSVLIRIATLYALKHKPAFKKEVEMLI